MPIATGLILTLLAVKGVMTGVGTLFLARSKKFRKKVKKFKELIFKKKKKSVKSNQQIKLNGTPAKRQSTKSPAARRAKVRRRPHVIIEKRKPEVLVSRHRHQVPVEQK